MVFTEKMTGQQALVTPAIQTRHHAECFKLETSQQNIPGTCVNRQSDSSRQCMQDSKQLILLPSPPPTPHPKNRKAINIQTNQSVIFNMISQYHTSSTESQRPEAGDCSALKS